MGLTACEAMGPDHRTVILPFPPTAEHLAAWAYARVAKALHESYGDRLRLEALHVRETPKSWATCWASPRRISTDSAKTA